ncbi:MAG TPA: SDR family oxidoreductase [Propionicimonas sp.]|uniref:SDR family oxidoreductase n=1 Tax=Propionicimonas sp. TaxID=1955623 RepID=UPI002F428337
MGALGGRVALVTGVGRRRGIGFAIASRLVRDGADVMISHFGTHDAAQPWGADDPGAVLAALRALRPDGSQQVRAVDADLTGPTVPDELVDAAVAALGTLDILVCDHARSGGDGSLGELDAAMIDGHYAANTRSSLLLAQAFARVHDDTRPGGRVVFMTSGQGHGPMPGEIAYASSKAALAGITATIAHQLAPRGITVNTVNPGPVNTGYLDGAAGEALLSRFPLGRLGEPDDPARLIAWLVSDEAAWVTAQVITTDGGFSLS